MENVRDLLDVSNKTEEPSIVDVHNIHEIRGLLDLARNNRKVAETSCNEHSSRSHCIFTLTMRAENKENKVRIGTLNLIDLAGSERVGLSKVEGERLKETMAINKSLSQLSTVITSIAKKHEHIPYRNSKLTHILQNSLSGDSKTLMMVMISPLVDDFNQTVCSLRFAETVTECIVKK
jgi:kinesin family protein C1